MSAPDWPETGSDWTSLLLAVWWWDQVIHVCAKIFQIWTPLSPDGMEGQKINKIAISQAVGWCRPNNGCHTCIVLIAHEINV